LDGIVEKGGIYDDFKTKMEIQFFRNF